MVSSQAQYSLQIPNFSLNYYLIVLDNMNILRINYTSHFAEELAIIFNKLSVGQMEVVPQINFESPQIRWELTVQVLRHTGA